MKRITFIPVIVTAFGLVGMSGLGALSLPAAGPAPSVTLKPDLTIGVEEGDENLMFGAIVRIDLDGRGNIYVLDYKYRKISVFGADGKFLRAITVAAGQGPQEATNLSGIAVTPGGTLFVNDMRKVIVYGPDGGYLRTFLVDFMISSIGCPGTEDLVAIGPHAGKILHVFDPTGKLVDSFGDLFPVPAELEPMKEMPMFGAPILFNCAKDGRIFVLNPHKYEVSVFKDRSLEQILKGESELFKPLQQRGRGFVSTAAHIVSSGDYVFVCFQNPDPKAPKTMDVFKAGKQVGRLEVEGTPRIVDPQGRVYFAEEEGFPKIRRYSVVEN
ncbi:MAG: 6-bladed beta-propeller [Candidatus Aminicenantes bacterium]|nr:6-bladed beta-propeller [Candidatus Aminicenantes bacterium]